MAVADAPGIRFAESAELGYYSLQYNLREGQLFADLGAEVTAVCSADKADFVRSLGADHVLDYRTSDPTRTGQRYDWILAVASHHSLPAYRRALRPGGHGRRS